MATVSDSPESDSLGRSDDACMTDLPESDTRVSGGCAASDRFWRIGQIDMRIRGCERA